ncbi:NACHT domain-containing protein [Mycena venus]|uniref:NACHT domain-containing protein n=1 Tax=Mycena venus TaxID=2733690 RepID=A0A8H6YY08_9AGAR|nr:NACHT domain-containing protein [Mycena venus]
MPPMYSSSGFNDNSRKEQRANFNVNNHIYGGVGGHGGWGGAEGQGGSGGAGEGPTVNYYIDAEEGNINHIHRHGEPGLHILQRAAARDSFHDSAERYPLPKCHPETRTEMLEDLMEWTSGDKSDSSVLWLHGPAGAGKSAIAQSLCQQLDAQGRLGASFFFKRKHSSRGNAKQLFPTLAYQLAILLPELSHAISQKVEENPSLFDRSLSTQLRKLILEPCRQCIRGRTLIIVIDGLDECESHEIQQEILRLIGVAIHEGPLPLRFFVGSRPEPHIHEIFMGMLKAIHRPVNIEQSFEDVRKYLLDEFARIHGEHRETMAMIPKPWPSPKIISNLVKKSSGYFIYASTVIKFIDDKNYRPTERLKVIVGVEEPYSGSPFVALDELYIQILSAVPDRPRLLKILTVIAAKLELPFGYTDELLDLEPGDVQLALRGLQSVIHVEKNCADKLSLSPQIVVHHASFYDFLQDRTRAGIFYVGDGPHLTDVCGHVLKAFSYTYDDPSLNRRGPISR